MLVVFRGIYFQQSSGWCCSDPWICIVFFFLIWIHFSLSYLYLHNENLSGLLSHQETQWQDYGFCFIVYCESWSDTSLRYSPLCPSSLQVDKHLLYLHCPWLLSMQYLPVALRYDCLPTSYLKLNSWSILETALSRSTTTNLFLSPSPFIKTYFH